MYNSEYIREGDQIILREGRTKIQGKVIQIHFNEKPEL